MSLERSFGYWLKRSRKALDLTQAGLASQVGCSAETIRKLEAEERRPSVQMAERLAEILRVPREERAAFLRFTRGDWHSAPAGMDERISWQISENSPRTRLPSTTTSFVGREKEVALVREYLLNGEIRLVTLTGPPGIGKTRLGVEVARTLLPDFPDGVFFVALARLEDPALIVQTVFQALGYVETGRQSADEQLIAGIGKRKMLIVLDNCEHMIEETSAFASRLLSACPHLKILATSRESLRISGEWIYTIPAFRIPSESSPTDVTATAELPALTLFVQRAHAVRSDFALNAGNLPVITAICARLDGLPLAIELMAARMRLMTPQALLDDLDNDFILSANGMRALSPRHKTLNDAIRWSYNLLSEEEQRLFACLSVFSGSFGFETAGIIFSSIFPGASVAGLITSLWDKSLLQQTYDPGGEIRFYMLVTIQEFARACLRGRGEEADARDRHLTYFLDLAERAEQQVHGLDQLKWINWVEDETDNFRAALNWCVSDRKVEPCLRLLTTLSDSWLRRDHAREIRSWFNAIRILPGVMDSPLLYARLLNYLSQSDWVLGDLDHARPILEEGQAILIELGTIGEPDLAMNLCWSGMVAHAGRADDQAARAFFERSFELYQKYDDLWGMAFVSFGLGVVMSEYNGDVSALPLFKQSLIWFRQLGDIWGIGRVSQFLGQLFLMQGDYEQARIYFEDHLKIDESLRFNQGTMVALNNFGNFYRYQGDYDQATGYYEKSMFMSREHGDTWALSNSIWYLGLVALHRNDYQRARQLFIDYYNLAREIYGGELGECDFLAGMAAVAGGTIHPERAAKLHGAGQALFEATDYRIPPFDRAEFDRHIHIAEQQLGGSKFEECMSEGYAMSMEQAIEYAFQETNSE